MKAIRIAGAAILALALIALAGLWIYTDRNRALPGDEAFAALGSDDRVVVADDGWLTYRPATGEPGVGVIFYPGAHCDVRGYAPVLHEIAGRGYLVVNVSMPFDMAVLGSDRATGVMAAHPEIMRWLLIGHSLGGAMAASFVHDNPGVVDGLMLWDSYPPDSRSLANSEVPVWLVHRATPDGEPSQAFASRRYLFPADSRWTAIAGGNHMNFGDFVGGPYEEEWEASITQERQHAQVLAATLGALREISAGR